MPFRSFGRGTPPVRGYTKHGYEPITRPGKILSVFRIASSISLCSQKMLCFHGFGPGVLVCFSHRFKINNSKELHKPSSWLNLQKTKLVECKGCQIRVLRHHSGTVDGQKPSTKWESWNILWFVGKINFSISIKACWATLSILVADLFKVLTHWVVSKKQTWHN